MMRSPVQRRSMRLIVAVVAVAALAACLPGRSSDSDAGPAGPDGPPAPDPCLLLTPAEIADVRGGPTEPGEELNDARPGHRACAFSQEGQVTAITSISVFPGDKMDYQDEYETVKANFPVDDIAGLGDGAFIGANVLHVHKGQFIITLVVLGPESESEKRAIQLALAAKAVARL
jgi:hypothetical protein